ncbi:MAG: ribonuclease PH [Alphaproteobacteria bacterium]|nr:ribonuclease PH [Alphaproteobacteria bacterium]
MRKSLRKNDELRNIELKTGVNKYADGSCLITCGDTQVMCTATIEPKVPLFLKHSGQGWVTAEYGMLPGSCTTRVDRDKAKQGGRTAEIQRLIGRSLRSVVDLQKLGERQVIIDCDVIQADGGTRTASITGGYIALYIALKKLQQKQRWTTSPILDMVAGISCGIVNGEVLLDLDYEEDSNAETDSNFVMTESGGIVEIQGTAEKIPFTENELTKLITTAKAGLTTIFEKQKEAIQKIDEELEAEKQARLEARLAMAAEIEEKKLKKALKKEINGNTLAEPTLKPVKMMKNSSKKKTSKKVLDENGDINGNIADNAEV